MRKKKKAVIALRVDEDVKQYLNDVLTSNGMTISEAMRLYVWQIVTQNGIPFKGFVSNKLPAKKSDELEGVDAQFHDRYFELKEKLMHKALRGLEIEVEKPCEGDPDDIGWDIAEDKDIIENFLQRVMRDRHMKMVPIDDEEHSASTRSADPEPLALDHTPEVQSPGELD